MLFQNFYNFWIFSNDKCTSFNIKIIFDVLLTSFDVKITYLLSFCLIVRRDDVHSKMHLYHSWVSSARSTHNTFTLWLKAKCSPPSYYEITSITNVFAYILYHIKCFEANTLFECMFDLYGYINSSITTKKCFNFSWLLSIMRQFDIQSHWCQSHW